MNAIIAKFKPRNREEKRKMLFEFENIEKRITDLECSFGFAVFNDEGRADNYIEYYRSIYAAYLEWFLALKKWLETTNRLKYWEISETYFCETYKPHDNSNNRK